MIFNNACYQKTFVYSFQGVFQRYRLHTFVVEDILDIRNILRQRRLLEARV